MEKIERKLKEVNEISNPRYAFHPEFLYRPSIIDFNRNKVDIFDKMPQPVNHENQFNGVVLGTLEKSGKYVHLAAFDSGLTCGDYQRVSLDMRVEVLAFHVNKSIFDIFSSNFERSDLKYKIAYCFDYFKNEPFKENFGFTYNQLMIFSVAKNENLSFLSAEKKMWLWAAFDADGNILNPYECFSWKPCKDTREYEYVLATGRYLYHDCEYTVLDVASIAVFKLKWKDYWYDSCEYLRHKETGELGFFRLRSVLPGCVPGGEDNNYLYPEELEVLLKDKKVSKKLHSERYWPYDIWKKFFISKGKLCDTTDEKDKEFMYPDKNGEVIEYLRDYEIVSQDTYWKYSKTPQFKIADSNPKFFVCGKMLQKSSGKIFYLTMCDTKNDENGFDISEVVLKTLLEDDKVAKMFEGKSFMVSDSSECFKVSNRKLLPIFDTQCMANFILQDENCIPFIAKYDSFDWELIAHKA